MRRRENLVVLILEDEAILRRNLARFLERRGHRVLAAGSIGEARELLRAHSVDAAILDVGLPDGNGLELLATTGVGSSLVISAEADPRGLERLGVEHFFAKPLELPSVARCLEGLAASQLPA